MQFRSYSVFLLLIFLFSCSSSDDSLEPKKPANLPPADFLVTVSDVTDRSAVISWTEALDPDGDHVNYRVLFMDQEMERSNNNNNFFFSDLDPEMNYQVRIEASDGDHTTTSEATFTTKPFSPRVFEGSVRLQNQQEVEDFGKEGFNIINGWLEIMDQYGPATDISDLSPLSGLMEIKGSVRIVRSQLKNLQGLDKLKTVEGPVQISSNPELVNIQGLEALTSMKGRLTISGHPLLENIDLFSNVQGINELYLVNNSKLVEVNLMQEVEVIHYLNISGNESLETVKGLEKLTEVQTKIEIFENPVLQNLPQFNELVKVNKQIFIANTLSTSLGFLKLEYAGSLYLEKNKKLEQFNGFNSLVAVESNVIISDNILLEDFCNFSSLAPPPGLFMTYGNAYNPSLESIKNGNCRPE